MGSFTCWFVFLKDLRWSHPPARAHGRRRWAGERCRGERVRRRGRARLHAGERGRGSACAVGRALLRGERVRGRAERVQRGLQASGHKDGATPLHYAVQAGALQTVKLLIKYKVDVNVADNDGWTPLHIGIQSRNRDIPKVLLVNGADRSRRTKDGRTALDLSLCFGHKYEPKEEQILTTMWTSISICSGLQELVVYISE